MEVVATLYDRFSPRLLRRLRGRYPYLDSEDLLQDAFVRYLRDDAALLRRFSDGATDDADLEAELERYLWDHACGVATNRRRQKSRRRAYESALRVVDPPAPDPERAILSTDLLRRLDDCLRRKSSRVYLYFRLRYHQGWSPREISKMTGWSMKMTYRLKQALDAAVGECSTVLGIDATTSRPRKKGNGQKRSPRGSLANRECEILHNDRTTR